MLRRLHDKRIQQMAHVQRSSRPERFHLAMEVAEVKMVGEIAKQFVERNPLVLLAEPFHHRTSPDIGYTRVLILLSSIPAQLEDALDDIPLGELGVETAHLLLRGWRDLQPAVLEVPHRRIHDVVAKVAVADVGSRFDGAEHGVRSVRR